jgi:hypothetical protein
MKKYIAVLIAALLVVGMSAFSIHHVTKPTTTNYVYFHFIPSDGSEGAYESTESWEVSESNEECGEVPGDPCTIRIDQTLLADLTNNTTKVESLVDFLIDQDGSGMAQDATDAVENYLVQSWKP